MGISAGIMAGSSIISAGQGIVSGIGHLFTRPEYTGLPRKPIPEAQARALAHKWALYYSDAQEDENKWTHELKADGPERAWINYATPEKGPPRGVAGVPAMQVAKNLYNEIGSPYELSRGISAITPSVPAATDPVADYAAQQVQQAADAAKQAAHNIAGATVAANAGASAGQAVGVQAAAAAQSPMNKTLLYVGGAVLVLGVLFFVMRKK
jgi:hypothetical protein